MVLARSPVITSFLDDPDYLQICRREMEFAQVERRRKRYRDELYEEIEQLRIKFQKKKKQNDKSSLDN
jgi:hypothetical protein